MSVIQFLGLWMVALVVVVISDGSALPPTEAKLGRKYQHGKKEPSARPYQLNNRNHRNKGYETNYTTETREPLFYDSIHHPSASPAKESYMSIIYATTPSPSSISYVSRSPPYITKYPSSSYKSAVRGSYSSSSQSEEQQKYPASTSYSSHQPSQYEEYESGAATYETDGNYNAPIKQQYDPPAQNYQQTHHHRSSSPAVYSQSSEPIGYHQQPEQPPPAYAPAAPTGSYRQPHQTNYVTEPAASSSNYYPPAPSYNNNNYQQQHKQRYSGLVSNFQPIIDYQQHQSSQYEPAMPAAVPAANYYSAYYHQQPQQQQYGGQAYYQHQQPSNPNYAAMPMSYVVPPTFNWQQGSVSCSGGPYQWAMGCDFKAVTGVKLLGAIIPSLSLAACASSCVAVGATVCNLFTYDVLFQTCSLFQQTAFPPAATPIVSNNAADVLQCGFVGTGLQPMGFTWNNATAPACPTPADQFKSATGCNFTAPATSAAYSTRYRRSSASAATTDVASDVAANRQVDQEEEASNYGGYYNTNSYYASSQYPSSAPSPSYASMMSPYISSSPRQMMSSSSYGGGDAVSTSSSNFATLGSISSVSSVNTCATVCDVNTNCNHFFTDGQSCVLVAGTGLTPTTITSGGRCGQMQRAGQQQQVITQIINLAVGPSAAY